jgi:sulfur carrier protein ThiS
MSVPYKFKTQFDFEVFATDDLENELSISVASLDNLKPLIPKGIDLDRNIDLVGAAFNAAIVNRFNRNGDGISSATAKELLDYFVHKPTNIEHKKQIVVGHIVNAAFTDMENEKILNTAKLENKEDPFYISLAAVIYKTVNPEFAELLLKASDPEDFDYNKISASWELGFNEYNIAVGSQNLSEAEIISDPEKIKEFEKYLRANDGSGTLDDGTPVYRLVAGEVFPLGIGFTTKPAADVKGVTTHENHDLQIEEEEDTDSEASMPTLEKIQKNILKISQNAEINVKNDNSFKTMDTKELTAEFEKMLDSKLGKKSEFSQESVASMATVIMDRIREKDAEWKLQQEAAETEKADAITRAEEAKANIESFKTQLEEAQEKITSLESTISTAKAEELFNSRMENIDSQYDLEDSDRAVLAKEVAALESSEAAFESYQQKLGVILKHKGKAYKEEQEAAFQSKVEQELQKRLATLDQSKASASEEATVEDLVENVEVSEEPAIVNNNEASSQEESLRDKFMKAFNPDTVSVTY